MEHNLNLFKRNGEAADNLYKCLSDERFKHEENSLVRAEIEYKMIEVDLQRKNFIESFKNTLNLYQNWIPAEIENIANETEKKGVEFVNAQKDADELAKREIYGIVSTKGDNVELPEILKNIEESLNNITDYIQAIELELKNNQSLTELEKAELNYKLTRLITHKITLTQRYGKRKDYYENQFLPRFREDMKRKHERFETYLKNAQEFVDSGIDLELKYMLSEREKHKDDDEHEWLFFIALETRLQGIALHVRRHKDKYPKYIHLANESIYSK